MNEYTRDVLREIVQTWTDEQLMNYIQVLENRKKETHLMIVDLSQIYRTRIRKNKRRALENGPRGGV
jgi:hypothetical protein